MSSLALHAIAEAQKAGLGGLCRKPVAPCAGDIRYRILRPFKRYLAGTDGFTREEMDGLVESVPGVGLRLDASSRVVIE